MMVKMLALGMQLFFPLALFGGLVLIPIHLSGDAVEKSGQTTKSINPTQFMKLTMTNVPEGSPLLWVHCLLTVVYVWYACWLLRRHFRQFVSIRQKYMQRGGVGISTRSVIIRGVGSWV
jgi:hypothetical protein